jgi:hypothetical protein
MNGYCLNHVNLEINLATSLLNWRPSIVEGDQKIKFQEKAGDNFCHGIKMIFP